jgi:hypothetical protein
VLIHRVTGHRKISGMSDAGIRAFASITLLLYPIRYESQRWPGRLRHELARCGWSAADFARHAGISHPTVSAAMSARPIAERSLGSIARALASVQPDPMIDRSTLADAVSSPRLGGASFHLWPDELVE